MSYAFIQDVPADEKMYHQMRDKLPSEAPAGLVAHIVIKREEGLRYVDVWETEAQWGRFRDECVEPAVSEVLASYGIAHDHSQIAVTEVEVIDTWCGTTADSWPADATPTS